MAEADVQIVEDVSEGFEIVDDPVNPETGEELIEVGLPEGDGAEDVQDYGAAGDPALEAAEGRWSEEDRESLRELFGDDGYAEGVANLDAVLSETFVPEAILDSLADGPIDELGTWLAEAGSHIRGGVQHFEPAVPDRADLAPLYEAMPGAMARLEEAWGPGFLANMGLAGAAVEALGVPEGVLASLAGNDEGLAELIALGSEVGHKLVRGPAVYSPQQQGKTMTKQMTRSAALERFRDLSGEIQEALGSGKRRKAEKLNREQQALGDVLFADDENTTAIAPGQAARSFGGDVM